MKTNSSNRKNILLKESIILGKLKTKTINKLAKLSGFIKRQGGKISPTSLIIGFLKMVSKQRNTYADWATEIGLLEMQTITKQSMNERMNEQTEVFIKQVVKQQLSDKLKSVKQKNITGLLKNFNNIFIDDSTTLHLPDELCDVYPGNVSRGKKKSLAKIHALYNLTSNNFAFLDIHSFTNNDQSLSSNVLPYLQKGDLCLRDLGFLVLSVLEDLINKGVYCLSRKKYKMKIYDIKTGDEINLTKELKYKKVFDKEVLLGTKQQLKIRVVAIAISQQQANERIRKAKKDRDRRLNHSQEYYQSLSYSFYITNISKEMCSAKELFQLYKLRWNIEVIFKSWKSCFSLEKIIHRQCVNENRVNCIIYLMLLYIYLFHVVWRYCEKSINPTDRQLSILKLASFFRKHFNELIFANKYIYEQIQTHCLYDKRKDRENSKEYYYKCAA
jgi:hypothetical protein